jgi:antitoxin HicB
MYADFIYTSDHVESCRFIKQNLSSLPFLLARADLGKIMKKKHLGSNFEDFLESEGILEECRASVIKFKLAHELEKAMSKQKISKAEMAKRLKTSRTGIDRLLDPDNTSITLNTMAKVAHLLGKRIDFALR